MLFVCRRRLPTGLKRVPGKSAMRLIPHQLKCGLVDLAAFGPTFPIKGGQCSRMPNQRATIARHTAEMLELLFLCMESF